VSSSGEIHLSAVSLEFESEAAYGAGMAGPEGRATRADLADFATAGVTLLAGPAGSVVSATI
jgi:hypothetical protein